MGETGLLVPLWAGEPAVIGSTVLGGKAAALARLIADGHPVPRSVVLTTDAYVAVAATPQIRSLVERLHGPRSDDVADEEIDRAFLDAPLPAPVGAAIETLAGIVGARTAVRSSATSEDLSSAAFPGQYRSILDVDPAGLERAVRLVWASLWHLAPRVYRRQQGVDDRGLAMAVLVMEMIEPVSAGVLFTRDPVGDEANVRLEVVAGRGEALVSGAVTPEAHTWPRGEAPLAAADLLGRALGELLERGLELEAAWGTALDIEFAIDRTGELWLVQARPVTARAASAPAGSVARADIAEMLPGLLPPLLQATAGRHVDEGFRNLLAGLGADLDAAVGDGDSFVRFDRSRAVLDLALLRRAAVTVPGSSADALDRGDGVEAARVAAASARSPIVQLARALRHRRAAVIESEIVVEAVDRLVADDAGRGENHGDDLADLLARWERLQDLGARATNAEMAIAALATAAFEGVERTLTRHTGPDRARELAQQLTTRSRDRVRPLDRCLRSVGADPTGPASPGQWREALARSGSRSVFGGPTWEEDPDLARLSLVAVRPDGATAPTPRDPLGSIVRVAGSRQPRLSNIRRRFVRREAADATELLDRRERAKRALLDLGGIAHRLTIDIAERLAARGVLPSATDVWLLTPTELRAAVVTGRTPDDLLQRNETLTADRSLASASTSPTGGGSGWPASPGRACGRAVVVTAPRAGALERGDVLVAHTTDAGWCPLFALAGAIVVEEGGPLSHASIVARELGVPAVVNLPGIVARVRAAGPDATIEVDGSTGAVTLVESVDPSLAHVAPVIEPPVDEPRLGVFVTGLIGASALFGLVVSITEAVSSARGIRHTRARAAIPAAVLADVVRHGTGVVERSAAGLAPVRHYQRWTAALLATGLLVGTVTTIEYVVDGSADRILWLVTALSTMPAALAGAHLAHRAATRWPDVPPLVRRVTPSQHPHTSWREARYEMPALHRRWVGVFGTTALALLVLNLIAPTGLSAIDEPLYDALGAPDPDPWGPDWFGMYFGRPQVVVPIALLVALFTVRCRVLAVAYPLTIMFGGLLNLGLGSLLGKERPPLGEHADQTDSFPSGHAIEVTLLLGLAPLAVAVLLQSRWAGRIARLVASGVLAVMLVDGLREGSHWPTDHLAGFAIAMTAVVLVHALAWMPSLHRSCTHCPALALRRDPAEEPGGVP